MAVARRLLTKSLSVGQRRSFASVSDEALINLFPDCMTGSDVDQKVSNHLYERGFAHENTLFAESSCPDEINRDNANEDVTMLMHKRWGSAFPLGGLGGIPFAGRTGWGAFASHVPTDGNIFVLFAPHVGVANSGTCGKVLRPGQDGDSSACGAAIGALAALKADPASANFPSGVHDHQMDCIKHLLLPYVSDIESGGPSNDEQAELAYYMYKLAQEYLDEMITDAWMGPNSKLAVLGGIMVNRSESEGDRFQPLSFQVQDGPQGNKTDEFQNCFGSAPPRQM